MSAERDIARTPGRVNNYLHPSDAVLAGARAMYEAHRADHTRFQPRWERLEDHEHEHWCRAFEAGLAAMWPGLIEAAKWGDIDGHVLPQVVIDALPALLTHLLSQPPATGGA